MCYEKTSVLTKVRGSFINNVRVHPSMLHAKVDASPRSCVHLLQHNRGDLLKCYANSVFQLIVVHISLFTNLFFYYAPECIVRCREVRASWRPWQRCRKVS